MSRLGLPVVLAFYAFHLPLAAGRHLYAIVTGILLIYYPFGNGIFNAFVPTLVTYGFMLVARKQCGRLAWLVDFSYLIGWWEHLYWIASRFRPSKALNSSLPCTVRKMQSTWLPSLAANTSDSNSAVMCHLQVDLLGRRGRWISQAVK